MEALQRAARRLRVEGAGWYMVRVEIVEQGPRDGGLADPALVSTHHDHDWLGHKLPLSAHLCLKHDPRNKPSGLLGGKDICR